MRTFLIRVVQLDGKIYLNSCNLDVSDNTNRWMSQEHVYNNRTIMQRISDQFDYDDKTRVEAEVGRIEGSKFGYGVKGGEWIMLHDGQTISYMLPQDPTMALDFLSAYCNYLDYTGREFSSIQFIDFDAEKKFSHKENLRKKNLLDLSKLKAANADVAIKIMIDKILAIKNTAPEYQQTLKVLRKLQRAGAKPGSKMSDLLQGLPRAAVMLDMDAIVLNIDVESQTDILRRMYLFARPLIGNLLGGEAARMLDAMHTEAKRQAFSGISREYPDWYRFVVDIFLYEKFELRPDGKLAVNYLDSKYLKMRKEVDDLGYTHETLRSLANEFAVTAGLAFEQSDDLKQLVFTEESSKKLIAQKLHINSDFMKKIVRIKNDFNRFYKSFKEKDGALKDLPLDVARLLIKTMYPEIAAVTNLDKLLTHDFFDQSKVLPLFPSEPPPEPERRKRWFW